MHTCSKLIYCVYTVQCICHQPYLLVPTQLSFDDIAKYGGVYGEKNAPLSSLQVGN